jgi:dTDP-4-amino-4,6-dideoxygalactose transaminase
MEETKKLVTERFMKNKPMGEFPLLQEAEGIPLFYPHVPEGAKDEVLNTLSTRWIGQGPKVDLFENKFSEIFLQSSSALAVGSGTDALHIAYILAGLKPSDEVLVPVFTCTATNIPLLYIGAKIVFVDIDPMTMNISIDDLVKKITKNTKAIVCVDYGGVPCDYDSLNEICKKYAIPLIADAAHSLGSKYGGIYSGDLADFSIFSFQAIKTLTTGDGGMLTFKNPDFKEIAKRLRWFGIDRSAKQKGIWENDISEIGYKYQMNDIAASIGLAGLNSVRDVILHRNKLFKKYEECLLGAKGIRLIGKSETKDYFNAAWIATVVVEKDRVKMMSNLRAARVESAQVHYRNDRYSIFGGRDSSLKNMDQIEDKYLVLPLHTRMSEDQVEFICRIVRGESI